MRESDYMLSYTRIMKQQDNITRELEEKMEYCLVHTTCVGSSKLTRYIIN